MGEDAIIETMEKVVFDTDIGSDVNGTLALAC